MFLSMLAECGLAALDGAIGTILNIYICILLNKLFGLPLYTQFSLSSLSLSNYL